VSQTSEIAFITPTWAGDIDHFRVMRASFETSPLGAYPHYAIVQTEDLPLFDEFRESPGLTLLTTQDVLPEDVERRRVRARALSDRFGRNFTRICGSLKRTFSWPKWPSYTGWHTQQLCKLKLATELDCETVVVVDSDVLITRHASASDFLCNSGTVCFASWKPRAQLRGKVRKWIEESEKLVGATSEADPFNVYFDTPFVFSRTLLKMALEDLESRSGSSWHAAMLSRPPRRWSEFGFYKAFLTHRACKEDVEWREPSFFRYLYDTSDPRKVVEVAKEAMSDPEVHYLTIHSQASGKKDWDPKSYLDPLASMIEPAR